jgi:crotonobetainyl-CoA:carnitine CoA-transferase CaiB-like acyl-CoA transferase
MFDATLAIMASAVVPWLVTGRALERTGNTGYSGQPTSALFTARDGRHLSLGVVQQHQFVLLAKLLGHEEWLQQPRFADPEARRANAPAMQAALGAVLRERDAAEWESLLSAAGIPCGMVREIGEAASLPALEDRQLLLPLTVPGLPQREQVRVLGAGYRSEQGGSAPPGPPPRPDQHRAEILRWLGQG